MWPSARYSVKITEISCTPKNNRTAKFAVNIKVMLGDRNHVRMKIVRLKQSQASNVTRGT